MSAITQPAATGITAQADSASIARDQRREQEDALVGAGRDHRLLEHEFQEIGEGLEQAPGPDDVRAAAQLHRRPDLAVGVEEIGDEDQERDHEEQALHDDDRHGDDVVADEIRHRRHSAALREPAGVRAPSIPP